MCLFMCFHSYTKWQLLQLLCSTASSRRPCSPYQGKVNVSKQLKKDEGMCCCSSFLSSNAALIVWLLLIFYSSLSLSLSFILLSYTNRVETYRRKTCLEASFFEIAFPGVLALLHTLARLKVSKGTCEIPNSSEYDCLRGLCHFKTCMPRSRW